jgi:hypothetical protein
MPKGYVRIAVVVGTAIRARLRQTELGPLPERLKVLLDRLDQADGSSASEFEGVFTERGSSEDDGCNQQQRHHSHTCRQEDE